VLGLFHPVPVFGRLIHGVSTISFDCALDVVIAAPLFDLVVSRRRAFRRTPL
jgi:hypothetical protein